MKNLFTDLSLNRKLALFVFVLGFLALFAGSPYRGTELKVDASEMAMIVQKEVDHVSSEELAGWIVQGKADYRLLDLRTEKEFGEYHIPTAENMQLTNLKEAQLGRNEKMVLYSDGGIHSAQAWFLLKAEGHKGVYILRGGLEEWKDKILFPRLTDNASPAEVAAFEKTRLLSKFFGGSPQVGGAAQTTTQTMTLPKLESPTGAQPKTTPGKKKKEGC
ncbi:MAG: rhodanese-like domain-containing protein [Ignavibacteriales bacterium]|nr:rhodanese-like domain-containing protein [Ignavibacteriales bacterium]